MSHSNHMPKADDAVSISSFGSTVNLLKQKIRSKLSRSEKDKPRVRDADKDKESDPSRMILAIPMRSWQ